MFKYKKNEDNVVEVKEESYHTCNKSSPIQKLTGDDPVFQITQIDRYFFISTKHSNCKKGQKLQVIVEGAYSGPAPTTITTPSGAPFSSLPFSSYLIMCVIIAILYFNF